MSLSSDLKSILSNIVLFQCADYERLDIERLGGLTNVNYKITNNGAQYVLRIPGEGTNEYIDRTIEKHNARVAARAGINAEIVFFDSSSGVMVTRFLEHGETMSPEKFRNIPGAPARAARAFRQIHDCGEKFRFRFELFAMIDEYLQVLGNEDVQLPDGYHGTVEEAGAVREALGKHPAVLKPSHCDPLTENFIDNGERMWILDWEYSGMNDPLWDLGDLSIEAGFNHAQDVEAMEAYVGGQVSDAVFGRMVIYKAMCDLLWTLWGLIQHAHGNTAQDFWAYSTERFDRCKRLMASTDFQAHMRAVRENR